MSIEVSNFAVSWIISEWTASPKMISAAFFHAQAIKKAVLTENLQEIVNLGVEIADDDRSHIGRYFNQSSARPWSPWAARFVGSRTLTSLMVARALPCTKGRSGWP